MVVKTVISLSAALLKEADAEAKRRGVSRSQLYRQALDEYLAKRRKANITAQLNDVYASEDSSTDPVLYEMNFRSLDKENW